MLRVRHQLKVFYSVICAYAVLVMDNFVRPGLQCSTKMLFHRVSASTDTLTVDCDNPIALRVKASHAIRILEGFIRIAVFSPSRIVHAAPTACKMRLIAAFNSAVHWLMVNLNQYKVKENHAGQ